ncbi:unnamed protein product, partial [Didymodactylos carnosus]
MQKTRMENDVAPGRRFFKFGAHGQRRAVKHSNWRTDVVKPYYDRETPSGRYGVRNVIDSVYHKSGDGLRDFYKGYLITLAINVPFSSIIWT